MWDFGCNFRYQLSAHFKNMRALSLFLGTLFFSQLLFSQYRPTAPSLIEKLREEEHLEENLFILYQYLDQHPDYFLPHQVALSEVLNPILTSCEAPFMAYRVALELAKKNSFLIEEDTEQEVINMHRYIRLNLKQSSHYDAWIWEDSSYLAKRYESGILLDLMEYFRSPEAILELRASLRTYQDPRLQFFAAKGLLKKNEGIAREDLLSIASQDETRFLLLHEMKQLGKEKLFPKEYLSQEALSRSDMVNWLVQPTELARTPDEIELLQVYTVNYTTEGLADFFLWKFKGDLGDWNENEWMVGLSGPFLRKENPSTFAYGYTFSVFASLEDQTPQEHFDELYSILQESQEKTQ